MRIDLHTHTTCSDGALTPAQLIDAATGAGVDVLAITDHDSVAAYAQLGRPPRGLQLVPGLELTATWRRQTVHIVGLDIDPAAAALSRFLSGQTVLRDRRAERIAAELTRAGLPPLLSAARDLAGTGQIGRVHFAGAMVAAGLSRNRRGAFRRYLGRGKAGDVRAAWPGVAASVAAIRQAGGIAVLAHPLAYGLTRSKLGELCSDFAAAGGRAIEVVSGAQAAAESAELARLAARTGLRASLGSDFHGPGQPWRTLGGTPALPAGAQPAWELRDGGVAFPASAAQESITA
ncbi:MAG: PHP domain-containing protein [Pseudomonadota bacterium]